MVYHFDPYSLDPERRELRCNRDHIAIEPQVFDLLLYLVRNRDRVVSKDDLLAEVWTGRIVSESTLSSRITAVRHAIGDDGAGQRLLRTLPRKGFRFVGAVHEQARDSEDATAVVATVGQVSAERRQVTIAACAIVDAAALSRTDPEEVDALVAVYRSCLTETIEVHGGRVARCSDDGIVAVFGYPHAREDDAERAVRAGLAVVQAVGALGNPRLSKPLQACVGIATGLVLVGPAAAAKASPPIVGEALFAAAQMQTLAPAGAVVVSPSTRALVGRLFEYEASEDGACRVLRESAIRSRFEALRTRPKFAIGREEELDLLRNRWRQAKSGAGRVVLVWGEPGIGKSHLVATFQDDIAVESYATLRYFCSPSRVHTALYPVIAELEGAAGFAQSDNEATKVAKLGHLVARRSLRPDEDLPLIGELLSIAHDSLQQPHALSAQRRKELLLEALLSHLTALAARQPLLVVLEDAHWLDPTTRELIDVMVERVRTLPLLLIVTYRPEFKPPWLGQSHVTAMTLNRLGRSSNLALVAQIAGGKALPSLLLDEIVGRTDGVPLFIEEMTKSILESGVLREDGDAYVLDGPSPLVTVPATLQASLVARLDRIGAARTLACTAAALGREFGYDAIKAIMQLPDAELTSQLDTLVASELVHQRGEVPWAVYTFKHALVQDAAYDTIPKADRPSLHRRIVDVFETQFPEIAERHPDVLAHHCAQANLPERAIDFSIRAAHIALARSAGVEAETLVERAMRLLQVIAAGPARTQIEGRLYQAHGEALVMTRGFASPQVMNAMSKARELIDEREHPLEALGALCGLFNYHLIRSESPQCLALVEPRLRGTADDPVRAVIHYLAGTAHLHLGNFAQSIEHLETARRLYDDESCRAVAFVAGYHLHSFSHVWLGLAHLYAGEGARAAQIMDAAVSDARRRSHPFTLVSALLALARFRLHTSDLAGAVAATEEGMAIAIEQRSPYHVSRASVLRAVNVVESGRPHEGIALMEAALAAHRATGANFQSSFNLSCLARAHALAGQTARADELALEAIADVERTGERWWEAEAWRLRGEILLAASHPRTEEAKRCFQHALACARAQHAKFWELRAETSLAHCAAVRSSA